MFDPRLIRLKTILDERGGLSVADVGDHIPFVPHRLFILHGMPEGTRRGGHAHRIQHQLLCMMSGRCVAMATDGVARAKFELPPIDAALYIPPMTWLELDRFSENSVCAVLASGPYDETDYIRDWPAFCASRSFDSNSNGT